VADENEIKQKVTDNFDVIADCYNHTALRFFPLCADRLVKIIKPASNNKILDVATGTGVVAIAMAQAVKASGRVMAVDLSENMLEQAGLSVKQMGLTNVDFFTMDAQVLDFKSNYFDAVTCSFGLFFIPDMLAALREWHRVSKPNGTVLFTSFGVTSFQPMVEYFIQDMIELGTDFDPTNFAAQRLSDPDVCIDLMREAKFNDPQTNEMQVGYHLRDAEEWWQVMWNSGFRHYLSAIPADKLQQFKQHHLKRVSELLTEKGIWMDVSVWVTTGRA